MAPDTLIFLISEEYEAQKKQRNQDDGGKRKEIDEAMAVDLSSWKESGIGNGKKRKKGACWNRDEMGHRRFKRKKPKGTSMCRRRTVAVAVVEMATRTRNLRVLRTP